MKVYSSSSSQRQTLWAALLSAFICGATSAFTVGRSAAPAAAASASRTLLHSAIPPPPGPPLGPPPPGPPPPGPRPGPPPPGGPVGASPPQYTVTQDVGKADLPLDEAFMGGQLDSIEDSDFDPNGISIYDDDDAMIPPNADWMELFPTGTFREGEDMELIQGGNTVRTYKMPIWADRCQYIVKTNGRPLKVEIGLWLGPLRSTHTMKIDSEDGNETPYMATLKFKALAQMLRIITSDSVEFPVRASVFVPPPTRAQALADNTEYLWKNAAPYQKLTVQGGAVAGGGGAIRWWQVPAEVKSVQVISWAKDTSKKSFKGKIWVLQGPNTCKQDYFLQCGGGSQPYHAVIQTPGDGCTIGIQNKKFIEDGLFEFAVLPYEVQPGYEGKGPVAIGAQFPEDKPYGTSSGSSFMGYKNAKRWWLK